MSTGQETDMEMLAEFRRVRDEAMRTGNMQWAWQQIEAALARGQRKRDREAMEIVRVMVDGGWYEAENHDRTAIHCRGCGVGLWPQAFEHRAECAIIKARALLAQEVATEPTR